jgi:hypothetical protein
MKTYYENLESLAFLFETSELAKLAVLVDEREVGSQWEWVMQKDLCDEDDDLSITPSNV